LDSFLGLRDSRYSIVLADALKFYSVFAWWNDFLHPTRTDIAPPYDQICDQQACRRRLVSSHHRPHDCAHQNTPPRPAARDSKPRRPSATRAVCSDSNASHLVSGKSEPGYLQMHITCLQYSRRRQTWWADGSSRLMAIRHADIDFRIHGRVRGRAERRYESEGG
jgi:hypothetical protein